MSQISSHHAAGSISISSRTPGAILISSGSKTMEWSTVPLEMDKLRKEVSVLREQNQKLKNELSMLGGASSNLSEARAKKDVGAKDCAHCIASNTGAPLNCRKCLYRYLFGYEYPEGEEADKPPVLDLNCEICVYNGQVPFDQVKAVCD